MMAGGVVLVVANSTDPESGHVGEAFADRGYQLAVVRRDRSEVPSQVPSAVDAVLLLGSAWSVAEPVDEAALEAECCLVRSAVKGGVPLFGICYGAQVVAAALGGRVWTADQPEVGLATVETTAPDLVPAGPWAAFHSDVLEPPPEAEVVARNGCGVQAFVLPGVLAVQFHPEVLALTLAGWLERYSALPAALGIDAAELVAQVCAREPESRRAAHALVESFLTSMPRV